MKKFYARASFGPYIALNFIAFIVIIVWLFLPFFKKNLIRMEAIEPIIFFIVYIFLTCTGLRSFKLEIIDDEVIYREGIFLKKTKMKLTDIKSVKITSSGFERTGKAIALPRLVLTPKNRKMKKLLINLKPFSREDTVKFKKFIEDYLKENSDVTAKA